MQIWHNQTFQPLETPVFRADDRLRLGHGVFDTMLLADGQPVFPIEHYERLRRHAEIMGIRWDNSFPDSADCFSEIVVQLSWKNNARIGQFAVNTLCVQGPSHYGLSTPGQTTPSLTIMLRQIEPCPATFSIEISELVRRNEHSPLSRIKSCNYGDNILALNVARLNGYADSLLLNTQGLPASLCTGNLMIRHQSGDLLTPRIEDGAMEGIIRQKLIDSGAIRAEQLNIEHINTASALYRLNSLRGITPIDSVAKRPYNSPVLENFKHFHLG